MSRIRTQPLLFLLLLVLGVLSWSCFGRSGSSPSRRCLAPRFCCSMHNACVTIDGGRRTRHPPPPIGLLSQLSKSPRFLGQGRQPATCPLDNTLLSRPGPPTSLRRVTKRDPEREVGEQPYCHTNAVDWCCSKPSCCLFRRDAPVSAR